MEVVTVKPSHAEALKQITNDVIRATDATHDLAQDLNERFRKLAEEARETSKLTLLPVGVQGSLDRMALAIDNECQAIDSHFAKAKPCRTAQA